MEGGVLPSAQAFTLPMEKHAVLPVIAFALSQIQ
jgi:hypothetical protein